MKLKILAALFGILLCGTLMLTLFQGSRNLLALLPSNTEGKTAPSPMSAPSVSRQAEPTEPAGTFSLPQMSAIPAGVVRLTPNAVAFRATAEALIACYNHRWGSTYLREPESWRCFTGKKAPCSNADAVMYSFLADEAIHAIPAIEVYLPENGNNILEVSLSLSEHDWTQTYEDLFRQQSLCMLAVFFPDTTDIGMLYALLRQEAGENAYISHSDVPVPRKVFVCGDVGCWAYTCSGMIHINIIPTDGILLAESEAKGTTIIQINEVAYADKS